MHTRLTRNSVISYLLNSGFRPRRFRQQADDLTGHEFFVIPESAYPEPGPFKYLLNSRYRLRRIDYDADDFAAQQRFSLPKFFKLLVNSILSHPGNSAR